MSRINRGERSAAILAGVATIMALFVVCLTKEVTAAPAESASVVIKDFMFTPMALTVRTGATVTWKNLDDEPHTVVSSAGLFRSRALDQNNTYTFRFGKPGVYAILCGIHPNMKATVTVVE